MRYRDLLPEARRRPDINKKTSALEQLKKYEGRDDIFVSFTHDVGVRSHQRVPSSDAENEDGGVQAKGRDHNARGHKIGINPQSGYDTPLGVYCYPISYALSQEGEVEYGNDRPYIVVMKARDMRKVLDLGSYTADQYRRDKKVVLDWYPDLNDPNVLEEIEHDAKMGTPGGMIWNLTRAATNPSVHLDYANKVAYKHYGDDDDEDEDHDDDYDDDLEDDDEDDSAKPAWDVDPENWDEEAWGKQPEKPYFNTDPNQLSMKFEAAGPGKSQRVEKRPPVQWARMLRTLGYDAAYDSDGEGIIHTNEPTQAVFFSKAGFEEVEVIHNIAPREPKTPFQIYDENPALFVAHLMKGKLKPLDKAVNIALVKPLLLSSVDWEKMPPEVVQAFRDRAAEFPPTAHLPFSFQERVQHVVDQPQVLLALLQQGRVSHRMGHALTERLPEWMDSEAGKRVIQMIWRDDTQAFPPEFFLKTMGVMPQSEFLRVFFYDLVRKHLNAVGLVWMNLPQDVASNILKNLTSYYLKTEAARMKMFIQAREDLYTPENADALHNLNLITDEQYDNLRGAKEEKKMEEWVEEHADSMKFLDNDEKRRIIGNYRRFIKYPMPYIDALEARVLKPEEDNLFLEPDDH